jgi:hypothetical protein
MKQPLLIDYIADMTPDDLRRNLRDAYGMTTALNRDIDMLNRGRVEQAARIAELEAQVAYMKKSIEVSAEWSMAQNAMTKMLHDPMEER